MLPSFSPLVGLTLVGLTSALSLPYSIEKRGGLIICQHLPEKWSHIGCLTDSTANRALADDFWCDDAMSEEKCIEYCDARGYSLAGVEYGRECYCGYALGASAMAAPNEGDCNMACAGNSEERCGGPARLNVFTNGDLPPKTNPGVNGFSSLGCYTDSPSSRALTTSMSVSGSMTVAKCTSSCSAAGFKYAGVEYGSECYCGMDIQDSATQDDGCNMICQGLRTEWCGGRGHINIYQSAAASPQAGKLPTGWTSKGCYTDKVSARTLDTRLDMPSGTMTIESCLTACGSSGFTMGGLEWSQECWCGNSILNGATAASSGCNMVCSGNRGEICGGSERLSLYTTKQAIQDCPSIVHSNSRFHINYHQIFAGVGVRTDPSTDGGNNLYRQSGFYPPGYATFSGQQPICDVLQQCANSAANTNVGFLGNFAFDLYRRYSTGDWTCVSYIIQDTAGDHNVPDSDIAEDYGWVIVS